MASLLTNQQGPPQHQVPPRPPSFKLARNVATGKINGSRRHFKNDTGAGVKSCLSCQSMLRQYVHEQQREQEETLDEDIKEKSQETKEIEQIKERHTSTGSDLSNQLSDLLLRADNLFEPNEDTATTTVCNVCSGTDFEGSCGRSGGSTLDGCLIRIEKQRLFDLYCEFCKKNCFKNSIGEQCGKDSAPLGCSLADRLDTKNIFVGPILRGPKQNSNNNLKFRCRHETEPGSGVQCPSYKQHGGPYGIGTCVSHLVRFRANFIKYISVSN